MTQTIHRLLLAFLPTIVHQPEYLLRAVVPLHYCGSSHTRHYSLSSRTNISVPAMRTRRFRLKSDTPIGIGDAVGGVANLKVVDHVLSRVEKEMTKSANSDKAVEMQRYLKTIIPMYGIQKPERLRIEKLMYNEIENILSMETIKTSKEKTITVPLYQECIRQLWNKEYRDYKYVAIDLAIHYKHCITFESLPVYESMIRDENMWWDLCDPIATNLIGTLVRKTAACNVDGVEDGLTELRPTLVQWIHDDNMWIRRAAILCQLKSKAMTDKELLFGFCRGCMHEKEFFIQKAIGWSLREYGKTNPSAVISFLEKEKKSLSRLSYREGSRILISKGLMTES